MREVPGTADHDALAIEVVAVVTDGEKPVLLASLEDICSGWLMLDLRLNALEVSVGEVWTLRWLLGAESVHFTIAAVAPSVRMTRVLKRASVMFSRVEEGADDLSHVDTMTPVMMRVRKVPATKHTAKAVIVVPVIHDRAEAFRGTGLSDVSSIHGTLDTSAHKIHSLVLEVVGLSLLAALHAHGDTVTHTMMHPAVRSDDVLQCTGSMSASVEDDAHNFKEGDTSLPVMMRMREMPAASDPLTITIVVV